MKSNFASEEQKSEAISFVFDVYKEVLAKEPTPLTEHRKKLHTMLVEQMKGNPHEVLVAQFALLLMRWCEVKAAFILSMELNREYISGPIQAELERSNLLEKALCAQREIADLCKEELRLRVKSAKSRAKKAADVRHSKKGGSRDKQAEIQRIWQSGKYRSRDRCAEEECGALGISFSTARKALRNIPGSA